MEGRRSLPLAALAPRARSTGGITHPLVGPSAPRFTAGHLFETAAASHLFLTDGSRIYDLDAASRAALEAALSGPSGASEAFLAAELGAARGPYIDDLPLTDPPVRSLSLAVAQKCNLACTYCYAEGGSFGDAAKSMEWPVAEAAVERLFADAAPGEKVTLAFLGGEPLVARDLVRRATERAVALGRERRIRVGFSITTNGTLLTPDDGAFFELHCFAVTVSLDGIGEVHDRLRSSKGGRPTYERIIANVEPLLRMQRSMQVSARVTVTPDNLALGETLDGLVAKGFHSVGFSPMLSSPTGSGELDGADLSRMLEQMVACGRKFEEETPRGGRYPFSNLATALFEIHRGTHRPYPCGAGAGYLGVSAEGGLYACHRFVADERGAMGDLETGLDRARQTAWLAGRHVHRQEPCKSCWARYLCGGGCHHEVIHRGRPACDYIRGWLHYCLQAYVRMLDGRPDFFANGGRALPAS